jgi:excisionase family DNA binding protein
MSGEFELILERLAERVAERVCERLVAHQEVASTSGSAWMGVEKAAAYLDWPKPRMYKLSASGDIPHYKQEGRLLFRSDELDRWLAHFAEGDRSSLERHPGTRAIVAIDGNKGEIQ